MPYTAKARARSAAGNSVWMKERTWGTISAAMAPCRTREPTSIPPLWAVPVSTDATVKPARPARNTRLRPWLSPSRPPVISSSAKARV
jgi:hypothetical protein